MRIHSPASVWEVNAVPGRTADNAGAGAGLLVCPAHTQVNGRIAATQVKSK